VRAGEIEESDVVLAAWFQDADVVGEAGTPVRSSTWIGVTPYLSSDDRVWSSVSAACRWMRSPSARAMSAVRRRSSSETVYVAWGPRLAVIRGSRPRRSRAVAMAASMASGPADEK
jgi:hypothetical protein